jgi:hypothetical protein
MDDVLKTLLIPFSAGRVVKPKENQTKEEAATSLQMTFEGCVQGNREMAQLARKGMLFIPNSICSEALIFCGAKSS